MPATIHCVRHAQGFHNLGEEFHKLPDPKLTPVGVEQCLALKNNLWQNQSQLSLITASPLSRTLHTAFLVFGDALSNGNTADKILAIPDAQETSDFPCDTGSDADVLKDICTEFKWPVDLSLVEDGWNHKIIGSRYAPSSTAIKARARATRRFLREKAQQLEAAGETDPQIVLVTHGGYLHYFTEDWEFSNKLMGTGWENCETRSYNFELGPEDLDAHLVETMQSRKRRGLDYPMLSKDKQKDLFEKGLQEWTGQGLQDLSSFEDVRAEHPDVAVSDKAAEVKVAA